MPWKKFFKAQSQVPLEEFWRTHNKLSVEGMKLFVIIDQNIFILISINIKSWPLLESSRPFQYFFGSRPARTDNLDFFASKDFTLTIFIFLMDGRIRLTSDCFLMNISLMALPMNSLAAPITASPA